MFSKIKYAMMSNRELQRALSRENDPEQVKLLLDAKATVNYGGHLEKALNANNASLVKILLQYKADHDSALSKAERNFCVWSSNNEIVNLLLEYKVSPGRLLSSAIYQGQAGEIVKMLLQKKADPNADISYWTEGKWEDNLFGGVHYTEEPVRIDHTLLTRATRDNNDTFVRLLLEHRADPNLCDTSGFTPLVISIAQSERITSLLLAYKATVNARSQDGTTPLVEAASQAKHNMILILLTHKAEINLSDSKGMTPLIAAAQKRETKELHSLTAIRALVEAKADTQARYQGKTASDWAIEAKYMDIFNYFQSLTQPKITLSAPSISTSHSSIRSAQPLPVRGIAQSMQYISSWRPFTQEPASLPMLASAGKITIDFTIKYSDLILEKPAIGRGAYGIVYRGKWKRNTVAIKELQGDLDEKNIKNIQQEAKVMASIPSEYLVRFMGICLERPHYCIVMDYMPGGNLHDFLHIQKDISWKIRYRISCDIASGLENLHDHNVLHRDLKSFNILLTEDYRGKLCDFGFSTLKQSVSVRSSTVMGTPQWMPPELVDPTKDHKPTRAGDIYSLGVILWEIATCKMPFEGLVDSMIILSYLIQGKRPHSDIPSSCPKAFAALIRSCCHETPSKRPSAKVVADELEKLWQQENKPIPSHSSAASSQYLTVTRSLGSILRPLSQSFFGSNSRNHTPVGVSQRNKENICTKFTKNCTVL